MHHSLSIRPLIAEGCGACVLALAVGSSVHTAVPTPLVAGIVLLTLVYILGPVSGAHLNPAVTLGLLSIGSVPLKQALSYIVAQMLGGLVAYGVLSTWSGLPTLEAVLILSSFGEVLGALILVFGVTTVVQGKVPAVASGFAIGGSLFTGALVVSSLAAGVLNPAVALGIGALSLSVKQLLAFALMPLVGGVLGAQFAKYLQK